MTLQMSLRHELSGGSGGHEAGVLNAAKLWSNVILELLHVPVGCGERWLHVVVLRCMIFRDQFEISVELHRH